MRKKLPKAVWYVYIALNGVGISVENPWEWKASFADRYDAKRYANGWQGLTLEQITKRNDGKVEKAPWKTKISRGPLPK